MHRFEMQRPAFDFEGTAACKAGFPAGTDIFKQADRVHEFTADKVQPAPSEPVNRIGRGASPPIDGLASGFNPDRRHILGLLVHPMLRWKYT